MTTTVKYTAAKERSCGQCGGKPPFFFICALVDVLRLPSPVATLPLFNSLHYGYKPRRIRNNTRHTHEEQPNRNRPARTHERRHRNINFLPSARSEIRREQKHNLTDNLNLLRVKIVNRQQPLIRARDRIQPKIPSATTRNRAHQQPIRLGVERKRVAQNSRVCARAKRVAPVVDNLP